MGFVDSRVVAMLRDDGVKPYAVEAELATANSVPAAMLNFIFAISSERERIKDEVIINEDWWMSD